MLRHTIDSLEGAMHEPVARSSGVPQASSLGSAVVWLTMMSFALFFCYDALNRYQRERKYFESLREAKAGIAKSNSTLEDERGGLEERIRSMQNAKGRTTETLRLTRQILKVAEADIVSLQSNLAKIEDELSQTLDTIDQVDASYYDELEEEIQKVKDETEQEQMALDEKVNTSALEANMTLSMKDDILREVSQAEQDFLYSVKRKVELYARLLRTIEAEQDYLPSV
ncbi:hypothetical protein NDN08_001542 [Rhodosorus marinus]|uniref:Uncharacterized protein n=1 Tax=Rhodosorus marinus TaxID=101924 RepID=A0AAV8UR30_9RHOD|nr:hypothetical protein NDN08_001542 [Rhodosorus marinus]